MPIKPKKPAMSRDEAEVLAIRGLAFLAEDGARLGRFMAITGLDVADLRARPPSHLLLAAVLEYFMGDESLLLVFSAEAGVAATEIGPALSLLSNPATPAAQRR